MASGKLGSADLSAGVDTLLFTNATTPQTFNIRWSNRNTVAVLIRAAIGSGDSPSNADYIEYDVTLPANGIWEDTGLVASSGEKVWVRSSVANVSVRAHGM